MLEFERLPKKLQKLLLVWCEPENWELNLLQACEKAGLNYNYIRKRIAEIGSADFYELRAQLVRKASAKYYSDVMRALIEKARKGNTRAIELFFKMRGELAEKLELSGGLDLNVQNRLLEVKKRLEEQGLE